MQLLDAQAQPVATSEPVVEGTTVRWSMPPGLADGSYLVTWRVISGDSHPVSGAFSFGIGVVPDAATATQPAAVPWPVTGARLSGYLGFTLVVGVVGFTSLCWLPGRRRARMRKLLGAGLITAVGSTILWLLLQGPYVAGEPLSRLLDRELLAATSHSSFGAWTQLRLYLYLLLAAILWPSGALESRLTRWLAAVSIIAVAATFSGTGHAAASGMVFDRVVDTVHVLAAGIWVGGLLALVVSATRAGAGRPTIEAFERFSRWALASVLVLVVTGVMNSLLRLDDIEQLWRSEYGRLLAAKVLLVAGAVAAAWASRNRLLRTSEPWATVRVEAIITLAVLILTAVLASTSPPGTAGIGKASEGSTFQAPASTTIEMDLGEGRTALLHLDGLTTSGSELHLEVLDRSGRPLPLRTARLQATLPARQLGPLEIPLDSDPAGWRGSFTFPLPGVWDLTLTVESAELGGLVTSGEVTIA
jgi:copper transport protein